MVKLKSYLQQVALSGIFWGASLGFFAIFRYLGLDRVPHISVNVSMKSLVLEPLMAMTLIGITLGVVYATIDHFFDKYVSKNLSLGAGIIFELFVHPIQDLPEWLKVSNFDNLKSMLVKVIIVVMGISFMGRAVT